MKLIKYFLISVVCLTAVATATAKSKKNTPQRVYVFGFAASFNDTIVHFTEIQTMDSIWLTNKNTFMRGRDLYSNQLRNYMTQQKIPHRTCVIFFDRKLGRLQKKFLKLKNLYTKGKKKQTATNDVRMITKDEFKFTNINLDESADGQ